MSLQIWTPQMELGWDLAAYLFFAGAGAGAYLAAVAARKINKELYANFSAAGIHMSWIAVAVGVGFLLSHLGRPERFINAFSNPGSWLTIGSWALTLFVIAGILSSLTLVKRLGETSVLWLVGALLALLVATYVGISFSTLSGMPLWHTPFIPWIFLTSALFTGIAAISLVLIQKAEQMKVLSKVLGVIAALIVIELVLLLAFLTTAAGAPALLVYGKFAAIFIGGAVLIGLLVPLGIFLYATSAEKKGQAVGSSLLVLGFLCALVGGFILRYVIIAAGQA